jgi:outer membrane protein TolC
MRRLFLLLPLLSHLAWGVETLTLELASIEEETLAHSPLLAATRQVAQGAEDQTHAQRSRLWPVLSVDGSYRYQTEVPTIKVNPLSPGIELGDNPNYSIGPALAWLAWDSGAIKNSAKALSHQAAAREQDVRATENQLRLAARVGVFHVQGSAERLRLLADGLRLAQAQRNDVRVRTQAGAASRQDLLQAETEVLSRRTQFREAQTALAIEIRSLLALSGAVGNFDLARPLPADLAAHRPESIPAPTLSIVLESPTGLRARFASVSDRPFDPARPEIISLGHQAEAARKSAQVARAGNGPTLQLAAKTSLDYPNGPVHEEINQKTVGAVARWSLFEGNRVAHEVRGQESLARASEEKRQQMEEDLVRDWQRARDRLAGLTEGETLNKESVDQQRRFSLMVYDSYTAGRATFLEVQAANLGLLQDQVRLVITQVDILTQLAVLSSLTEVNP